MKRNTTIVVALLVCLLGAWIYSEMKDASAVRPPEGATNLLSFLEARPQPSRICSFVHDGKTHIEVIGKTGPYLLSLRSGPPVYIFNENGVLVDWSRDVGENPSFVSRWGNFSNAISISIKEAKQLMKGREP